MSKKGSRFLNVSRRTYRIFKSIERLPTEGKGKTRKDLFLVHLNRPASTEVISVEMDRYGLMAATAEDARALNNVQRQFPIVALGSPAVFSGGAIVYCLLGRDRKRPEANGRYTWEKSCRFLAIRKA